MVNVLEYFSDSLEYGGQEIFMINMYKNFSDTNIHYTFCTPFKCTNKTLVEMTKNHGDKIIAYNYDRVNFRKKLKQVAFEVLKNNHFDVVHIHSGSIYTLFNVAKIAKKCGVKTVIVHSHLTGQKNLKYMLIKRYSDMFIQKYADKFLACSLLAGEWKFPKKIIEENKCIVVKNGIDIEKFKFNKNKRDEYRKLLNLKDDEFVLCNVGRLEYQKNHEFIVEIANLLNKQNFNYKVIIVGSGSLKSDLEQKIDVYGLKDRFIFLENRNDVAEILMASDLFVLPSRFEGLGIVAIESQASGLPTLCSKEVPTETNLTNLISYLSLDNVKQWANEIINLSKNKVKRENYYKEIEDAGYNAKESAKLLEELYTK